jgi:hypothetical protein
VLKIDQKIHSNCLRFLYNLHRSCDHSFILTFACLHYNQEVPELLP